jgi:serine/threonine protein phosphatase PrpC
MWIPLSRRPSFAVSRKPKYEPDELGMNNGGSHLLTKPLTDKIKSFNVHLCNTEIGHSSMQGYRNSMEDACIAVEMTDLADHVLVAILDGHAGGGASQYVSERLASVIAETKQYQIYAKLEPDQRTESIDLLRVALVQAYVDIDKEFYNYTKMVRSLIESPLKDTDDLTEETS